jgi:hypothetical protein
MIPERSNGIRNYINDVDSINDYIAKICRLKLNARPDYKGVSPTPDQTWVIKQIPTPQQYPHPSPTPHLNAPSKDDPSTPQYPYTPYPTL